MPVIQAAVVASRSKDPTGCWGPTFLSKLDMDAPVAGLAVLDTFNKGSSAPRSVCAVGERRTTATRTERMKEERRLVWRVLRHWTEIANGGRFPRRDEIDPWLLGEDGANLVLMAVQSPIELSHFVEVGVNLAVALCPTDTLAGVLLSQLPRVVSGRQGVMIEGGATLDGIGILYRSVLLPLSEDSVAIDHLLGAANYRLLREDEEMTSRILFRRHWI